ncbi:hypothetical protein H7F15_02200 [Pontibacter sp. Tf4]|uniref:hypothetical protein n=1 Tax=Pontibacter sp. Tf4 TaxID=2761620 RepID=UPI001625C40C|nr:hypothetical protein [Pontibacter sp. Tf4]MBB6609838.1 hypothetical protein [Pontibacter sp. Tf4]
MRHINLLKTEYLTIEYNAIDDYVYSEWHGELTNDTIKQGYESILFYLKKEYCHKLLDNHYDVQGLWADLAEWCAYDWHPRAEAAGLNFHAVIYANSHFSKLSTDRAIQLVKNGIIKGFDSVQDAESWLKFM